MRLLRAILYGLAFLAFVFFAVRLGSVFSRTELKLDRTSAILEKIRKIQKINLASSFSSRVTPDGRSNMQAGQSRLFFKYVAMIRIDAYIDYSQAVFEPAGRILKLPALEFESNVVPSASFLWKAEGSLEERPVLERRFTQSEEEIMRGEVLSLATMAGSPLRRKAYESCRNFFGRMDASLAVEFADER